jgi:hypothetical protein
MHIRQLPRWFDLLVFLTFAPALLAIATLGHA